MKCAIECVPCFVDHALHVAKMVTNDLDKQKYIMRRALEEASKMDLDQTPPELARWVHAVIRETTGVEDAYQEIKDLSTEFALELLPQIRADLEKFGNTFENIVRFVISGNIIDFGADRHFKLDTAHKKILDVMHEPLNQPGLETLEKAMERAENILFLADNCGEAVIDRLFLELCPEKITLAVRGAPILNDITPREVPMSNLDNLVKKVIDTGDATPGTLVQHSKPEFVEAFNNADLIVAKGQGNYETLSETDRPIVFLLRVKCPKVAEDVGSAIGRLQVIPRNINI